MKVIFAGSFDPVTLGHLNVIHRASRLFEEVIVGVLYNSSKKALFTSEERIEMLNELLYNVENVKVEQFEGLLVDYVKIKNADAVLRGLRTPADFEYERQLALLNRSLNPNLETVFLVTDIRYSYVSASFAREVASYGGDVSGLVPPNVAERLHKKFFLDDGKKNSSK